jgi:hypothetical protein
MMLYTLSPPVSNTHTLQRSIAVQHSSMLSNVLAQDAHQCSLLPARALLVVLLPRECIHPSALSGKTMHTRDG